MTGKNLVAVAFLTEATHLIPNANQLLGAWLNCLVPKEWGTRRFIGTGRKIPALIVKGFSNSTGSISFSDLSASENIKGLERYTQRPLSELTLECKTDKFAEETVWVVGFFEDAV
ncbi:MAG: hypothetical protein K8S62_12945 [Candidatus Sabulitectum sp.]|nr:hypothetical protein [Candidatus Sabulitectum sp.]